MIFKLAGRVAMAIVFVVCAPFAASAAEGEPEPAICVRLKEITTEYPNPLHDRILSGFSRERRCRSYFWLVFEPKPLQEILTDSELTSYHAAIARRDCQAAAVLLRRRFAEVHPKASFIATDKKEYEYWRSFFVSEYFHQLFVCQSLLAIDLAQRELDRLGMKIEPYRGSPHRIYDTRRIGKRSGKFYVRIYNRDRPVARLLLVNAYNTKPVYSLALLKLSKSGAALELHPLWELYLAFHLRDAGVGDPVIETILSRELAPAIRREIEQYAKSDKGWLDVPIHPHRTYPMDPRAMR